MRKLFRTKLLLILIFVVFAAGCHDDDHTGENCIDDNPAFVPDAGLEGGFRNLLFYPDSKITTYTEYEWTFTSITEGDKIVFRYSYVADDEEQIADDEYEEQIVFEVPAGTEEFLLSGEDLRTANAMFGIFCFCNPVGFFPVTSGCIKGQIISDTEWQIDINIIAEKKGNDFGKMLSERFIKP